MLLWTGPTGSLNQFDTLGKDHAFILDHHSKSMIFKWKYCCFIKNQELTVENITISLKIIDAQLKILLFLSKSMIFTCKYWAISISLKNINFQLKILQKLKLDNFQSKTLGFHSKSLVVNWNYCYSTQNHWLSIANIAIALKITDVQLKVVLVHSNSSIFNCRNNYFTQKHHWFSIENIAVSLKIRNVQSEICLFHSNSLIFNCKKCYFTQNQYFAIAAIAISLKITDFQSQILVFHSKSLTSMWKCCNFTQNHWFSIGNWAISLKINHSGPPGFPGPPGVRSQKVRRVILSIESVLPSEGDGKKSRRLEEVGEIMKWNRSVDPKQLFSQIRVGMN